MIQDLRYALRTLVRTPGLAAVVIIVLALGIGANTVIFTAANDFLLRSMPFAAADRLVALRETGNGGGATSPRDYLDWRDQNRTFRDLAAYSDRGGFNLTGAGDAERVRGMLVTASFFPLLGVKPQLGRTFLAREDAPGGSPVVVLGYSLWQRRFGGRSDVLGRSIRLDGHVCTVLGVMPPGFWYSNAHEEVYGPLRLDPAEPYRGGHYLNVIGRLKDGVKRAQAQADISTVIAAILRRDPQNAGQGVVVEPLREQTVREVKPALLALVGGVGLLLLIACANVANILLARAAGREREMAVRRAIGATSGRIVRQVLTESVLLSVAGAGAGLLVAVWGVHFLYAAIPADLLPVSMAGIDWKVLGFTGGVALLTGLLFGIAPAWSVSGRDLTQPLKESVGTSIGRARGRMGRSLMVAEVALSVLLLSGAGVLTKSFVRLMSVRPGFQPENVLTVRVDRVRSEAEFCLRVVDGIGALPGVRAVGAASNLPMTGQDWGQNLTVEGRPFRGDADYVWACHRVVTRGYFHAIGMRLLAGRLFGAADTRDRPEAAVINQTFADKAWPNEDPIGKRFRIGDYPKFANDPVTVIGVVADAKYRGLADDPYPEMFFSMEKDGAIHNTTFVIRAARNPTALAGSVRAIIQGIDADQPITAVGTLDDLIGRSVAPQRLTMLLGTMFSLLAMMLAGTGLYGVISYSVSQRRQEIGIRMALGAVRGQVMRLVLAQGLGLAISGVGAGIVGTLVLGQYLNGLLFQVTARDPLILAGVGGLVLAIAAVASYFPARRAVEEDPMAALRCQ